MPACVRVPFTCGWECANIYRSRKVKLTCATAEVEGFVVDKEARLPRRLCRECPGGRVDVFAIAAADAEEDFILMQVDTVAILL